MFTGLVEEASPVISIALDNHIARLTVSAPVVSNGARLGDSMAINGCCLTVVEINGTSLTFDAVPETMAKTNLGNLVIGSRVNLERPLQIGARLGGHFVQGHVDYVGSVISITPVENAVVMEISIPAGVSKYIVNKGSITVDGVSLTVADVTPHTFIVWTIPHTRQVTNLGDRKVGDLVNLEGDLLGKHIERLLLLREGNSNNDGQNLTLQESDLQLHG